MKKDRQEQKENEEGGERVRGRKVLVLCIMILCDNHITASYLIIYLDPHYLGVSYTYIHTHKYESIHIYIHTYSTHTQNQTHTHILSKIQVSVTQVYINIMIPGLYINTFQHASSTHSKPCTSHKNNS